MAIFIDASVLCAYANKIDVHHNPSKIIIEDIISKKYGAPIITDYIFDEVVTVVLRRAGKKIATDVGKALLNSEIIISKVDEAVFLEGFRIFQANDNLSFADCTNIAFMRIFGIDKIATFDKEFENIKGIYVVDE